MVEPAELQAKLKVISAGYVAKLPEKMEQIELAWAKLPQTSWDEEGFQALYRMVHSLTGSGKTFGMALLSDVARNLEEYLKPMAQAKRAPNDEQRNRTRVLLNELHQVALKRNTPVQPAKVAVAPPAREAAGLIAKDESASSLYWSPLSANRIFVVEDEPALAALLQAQLGYFGYEVTVFGALADFRLAMQSRPDVIVLMDVTFPGSPNGGIETMKDIQRGRSNSVPVIFLTAHEDFATRLEAARAGGIAFLGKPVDIDVLIDKLDTLTSPLLPEPYRILIVDDSEALTAYYSAVLEQAGMVVKVVNNPLLAMAALLEFTPDLILVDIYMPGCNGMELARIIRQMDAFVSIPIVFLSAESNFDKQLLAMGLGADDFLTKPIQPEHLVSSISSRVKRSLKLRSFMVRDSLTGLLNHTAFKDQMDREVAQAKRRGKPLSFAMVDIDHFKRVNDTYGHPAGDRVIVSLSRLLKQRLRETDMVGRYGGEEFAVILSNTGGAEAAKVLDAIRQDFAQLRHLADGKEFSVTFSCGVADISHTGDPAKLCDAADKALYQAKRDGRNRVMPAQK